MRGGGGGGAGDRVWGLLARFQDPGALVVACRGLRRAGYRDWETSTPFAVPELEEVIHHAPSPVSRWVLSGALGGALVGFLLQAWVSVEAYPLVVSAKPLLSWPAFIPVTFECGVLGGALGALAGFLRLARLPRFHHPLFAAAELSRATDDAFLLAVRSSDPLFSAESTRELLASLGAEEVETVPAGESR